MLRDVTLALIGSGDPVADGTVLLWAIVAGAVLAAAAVVCRWAWPARRLPAVGLGAVACLLSVLALEMFLVRHVRPPAANMVIAVPVFSLAAAAYAAVRRPRPSSPDTPTAGAAPPPSRRWLGRSAVIILGLIGIALLWVPLTVTTTDARAVHVVTRYGILGWQGTSEIRQPGMPSGLGSYADPVAFVLSVALTLALARFAVIGPVRRMIAAR